MNRTSIIQLGDGASKVIQYFPDGKVQRYLYLNDNMRSHSYDDNPSITLYNSLGEKIEEVYHLDGVRHRINGPAYISYKKRKIKTTQYIVYGINITKEEWVEKHFNQLPLEVKLKIVYNKEIA
jgi:hypothetical protein